jgi:hypothetical protein
MTSPAEVPARMRHRTPAGRYCPGLRATRGMAVHSRAAPLNRDAAVPVVTGDKAVTRLASEADGRPGPRTWNQG